MLTNHGRKKLARNIVAKHKKLCFGTSAASPTFNIRSTNLNSDLKLRIKIHEKHAATNTILKCVILTEVRGKEQ